MTMLAQLIGEEEMSALSPAELREMLLEVDGQVVAGDEDVVLAVDTHA